jgi:hypothetical protein
MGFDDNKRNSIVILGIDIDILKFQYQTHNFRPTAMDCHVECRGPISVHFVDIEITTSGE